MPNKCNQEEDVLKLEAVQISAPRVEEKFLFVPVDISRTKYKRIKIKKKIKEQDELKLEAVQILTPRVEKFFFVPVDISQDKR